jgi:hypothetical protein
MSTSKCKAKVESNCPYHGAMLRVNNAEKAINKYAAQGVQVPTEIFDEFISARAEVEKKEKNGWAAREQSDDRDNTGEGVYYPPMKKFKNGGSNTEASAMDKYASDRVRVAMSTDTEYILAALSKDKDKQVRLAVGLNRTVPKDILESLKNDKDEEVKLAATVNLDTPGTFSINKKVFKLSEENRLAKANS